MISQQPNIRYLIVGWHVAEVIGNLRMSGSCLGMPGGCYRTFQPHGHFWGRSHDPALGGKPSTQSGFGILLHARYKKSSTYCQSVLYKGGPSWFVLWIDFAISHYKIQTCETIMPKKFIAHVWLWRFSHVVTVGLVGGWSLSVRPRGWNSSVPLRRLRSWRCSCLMRVAREVSGVSWRCLGVPCDWYSRWYWAVAFDWCCNLICWGLFHWYGAVACHWYSLKICSAWFFGGHCEAATLEAKHGRIFILRQEFTTMMNRDF